MDSGSLGGRMWKFGFVEESDPLSRLLCSARWSAIDRVLRLGSVTSRPSNQVSRASRVSSKSSTSGPNI